MNNRTYEEMELDSIREQLERTQKLLEEATAEIARLKYGTDDGSRVSGNVGEEAEQVPI